LILASFLKEYASARFAFVQISTLYPHGSESTGVMIDAVGRSFGLCRNHVSKLNVRPSTTASKGYSYLRTPKST